jgi:hypothetical protein
VPVSTRQSTFGTILGTVHDASGAVIPGATVTLVNTGTTAQRIATSDGNGDFVFSNIDVGTYSVTITAQALKSSASPTSSSPRANRAIEASCNSVQRTRP